MSIAEIELQIVHSRKRLAVTFSFGIADHNIVELRCMTPPTVPFALSFVFASRICWPLTSIVLVIFGCCKTIHSVTSPHGRLLISHVMQLLENLVIALSSNDQALPLPIFQNVKRMLKVRRSPVELNVCVMQKAFGLQLWALCQCRKTMLI